MTAVTSRGAFRCVAGLMFGVCLVVILSTVTPAQAANNEFSAPSWTQLPAPSPSNTTPSCPPTADNDWQCTPSTSSWPPRDTNNPELYLNSAYWPAEKRPDIEMYAIQRYGYNYKDCIAKLPHYCFLVDAQAVGYPVTHTPVVGDLWVAPGECLAWEGDGGLPADCSDNHNDWFIGYVEQVNPDGSFVQSWGGSDTPADSGIELTTFSSAMDPYTDFIGLLPPGSPKPGTSAATKQGPRLSVTLRRTGLTVSVLIETAPGALGALSLSAQDGALAATPHGGGHRYTFRASRAGLWSVKVRFTGSNGWLSQTVTERIRI